MPDSLTLVSCGLMVAALVLGGYQFFRLFSVRPCPTCHQWVSRRLMRLGRSCPHCGHVVRGRNVQSEPLDAAVIESESSSCSRNGSCARCGTVISGTPTWRLWDDRSYCKHCLDRTAPSLWPIVEQQALQDRVKFRSGTLFIRWLSWFAFLLGMVDLTIVLGGMLSGHWSDVSPFLQRVLLAGNLISVVLFVPAILLGIAVSSKITTRVSEGLVRVAGTGRTITARLQDVTWHAGLTSELTVFPLLGLLRFRVIVIDWPSGCDELRRKMRSGVGTDLVSRERWAQFLTLAGVPVTPGRSASFDR